MVDIDDYIPSNDTCFYAIWSDEEASLELDPPQYSFYGDDSSYKVTATLDAEDASDCSLVFSIGAVTAIDDSSETVEDLPAISGLQYFSASRSGNTWTVTLNGPDISTCLQQEDISCDDLILYAAAKRNNAEICSDHCRLDFKAAYTDYDSRFLDLIPKEFIIGQEFALNPSRQAIYYCAEHPNGTTVPCTITEVNSKNSNVISTYKENGYFYIKALREGSAVIEIRFTDSRLQKTVTKTLKCSTSGIRYSLYADSLPPGACNVVPGQTIEMQATGYKEDSTGYSSTGFTYQWSTDPQIASIETVQTADGEPGRAYFTLDPDLGLSQGFPDSAEVRVSLVENGTVRKTESIWFYPTEEYYTFANRGGAIDSFGPGESVTIDPVITRYDAAHLNGTAVSSKFKLFINGDLEARDSSGNVIRNNVYFTGPFTLKRKSKAACSIELYAYNSRGEEQTGEMYSFNEAQDLREHVSVDDIPDVTYTGEQQMPVPAVKGNLFEGLDYAVIYGENTDAGYGTVTVRGIGDYYGSITKRFRILPAAADPQVRVEAPSLVYNGRIQKPAVRVYDGSRLISASDYDVDYPDSVNAGSYTLRVDLKNNSYGSGTASYRIVQKTIDPVVALTKNVLAWNGKVQTPEVTVKNGETVIPASQYTLSYAKGLKNIGTYTVRVTLRGNYRGSGTATYTIGPKTCRITGLRVRKGSAVVRWTKQKGRMPKARIAGYQIQYSRNRAFTSGSKTVRVKGYNKNSRTISGLKSKKRYYVRIRTYMKSGGKTYYSPWSGARSAKIR